MRFVLLNRAIKKYNQTEIQKVINIIKKMTGGIDDEKMEFCYHLFMGAISGDAICREYFLRFKQKTGELDGGYAEEYEDLKAMLELWEKGE